MVIVKVQSIPIKKWAYSRSKSFPSGKRIASAWDFLASVSFA